MTQFGEGGHDARFVCAAGEQTQQDGGPGRALHRQVHLQAGPEEQVQTHEARDSRHRRKCPVTNGNLFSRFVERRSPVRTKLDRTMNKTEVDLHCKSEGHLPCQCLRHAKIHRPTPNRGQSS